MSQVQDNKNYLRLTSYASMLAGTIARLVCYPMDTMKAKLYIQRNLKLRSADFITTMTSEENSLRGGHERLLQGTPHQIGSVPAYTLYITSYEWFKQNLPIKGSQFLIFMAAGFCAELVSCVLWLPIDVVKQRLQVQRNLGIYAYSGSIDALKKIVQREGPFGLYRGFGATLGSFGTFSAVYFLIYENVKLRVCQDPTKPQFKESIFNSLAAYLVASFTSNPLDIAKLRLQVQRIQGIHPDSTIANFNYRNQLHGVYSIYRDEGVLAFYRGYSARVLYGGSLTTLSMSLTEYFRNKLKEQQN